MVLAIRALRKKRKHMPGTPAVQTFGAKVVVQELRRQGLNVERIANDAGLEMRTLNREVAWIPFRKHAALLDIAAHETGDDFFGLHIAAQADPRDAGALGYVGLSSRTLGDALLNLEKYLATVTEAFRIELSIDDDLARVRFAPADPSFLHYRQTIEFASGVFVKIYQFYTKSEIAPVEVEFVHRFDGDTQEHQRIFGCPVVFGQKRIQMNLNQRDMTLPIESADDRLLKILISNCEEALKKRARSNPEHVIKLERCIIDLLPKGQAKAKIVAPELGMSERTLVRHLAKMGTSFTETLNQLRRELALKYIHQPELSLTQIAFLLGYSNQSAFSVAFKRTTGLTPRKMRVAG